MPEILYSRSILLLTRFDKILGENDKKRVLRRVCAEADELFYGVFPIALVEALEAGDDRQKWDASGADAFLEALLEIALNVSVAPDPEETAPEPELEPEAEPAPSVMPRRVAAAAGDRPRQRPAEHSDAPPSVA